MKPKVTTAREIQGLIDNEVKRILFIISEQRHKDIIEGWNKCVDYVYEKFKKRVSPRDFEDLKRILRRFEEIEK